MGSNIGTLSLLPYFFVIKMSPADDAIIVFKILVLDYPNPTSSKTSPAVTPQPFQHILS